MQYIYIYVHTQIYGYLESSGFGVVETRWDPALIGTTRVCSFWNACGWGHLYLREAFLVGGAGTPKQNRAAQAISHFETELLAQGSTANHP